MDLKKVDKEFRENLRNEKEINCIWVSGIRENKPLKFVLMDIVNFLVQEKTRLSSIIESKEELPLGEMPRGYCHQCKKMTSWALRSDGKYQCDSCGAPDITND